MDDVRSAQVQPTPPLTRGDRIKHLRLALAGPMNAFVSQGRFGEIVAEEQGRAKPYDTSTAKRWEDGAELELGAIEAMARIAQRRGLRYITRTWLAFGDAGVVEAREATAVPQIDARPAYERIAEEHGLPVEPIVEAKPAPKKRGKRANGPKRKR